MTTKHQVVVLGLGRFGQAVARELTRLGHDVLAIDSNEKIVQSVADQVTHAVQADITDRDVLEDLGVGDFDTAIIAVTSSVESSILATALVQQLGVERIIAKAANELHGSILTRVGATRVVYPERDTGIRVAHSFAAAGVRDYLDVAPGYGLARLQVPAGLAGKSLADIDLPRTRHLKVVALNRRGKVSLDVRPEEILQPGDEIIVAGQDADLERLPNTMFGRP